jgi:heterodisulfide reductase subunit A
MSEINLNIDGRDVTVEEGATILEAANSIGIKIPTLCYHPALSAFGACRICSVEIESGGRSRIVTSCNYPVEEDLKVQTRSDAVIHTRRLVSEMLLARCPNVEIIQELAREYGVEKPRFKLGNEDERCILCGLCARVCEERMGRSVINFVGRGVNRRVQTPFQQTGDADLDACMACGACATICPTGAITIEDITSKKPVPIMSEFDAQLRKRAPVYVPFPQAVPNVPVIDSDQCVHLLTGNCKICQDFCTANAIDFEQEDEIIEVEVGAIIVATGFDLFDPAQIKRYGYGIYENVYTSIEMERMISSTGPTEGHVQLKDGSTPTSVAIIHCVGSRDENYHEYCSRVCCMHGLKHAHQIIEKTGANVYQMYIDMRCYGKGYEEFYKRVSDEGVNFIRGKVTQVTDRTLPEEEKGKLIVVCEDTLLGEMIRIPVDMVVLNIALEPRTDAAEVSEIFSLEQDKDGFFKEKHYKIDPLGTLTDGIYLAGCCQGPKDIPDTVAQAIGAAAKALALVTKGEFGKIEETAEVAKE